ncbi:hypothetical protein ACGFZP_03750 [Kitasatospora sp. NPDC048239]|uniref:hypothetical protein n=1 Tax=Kitasatospora sp. NPDC048239 TaxID=3364046 RepID=UPI003722B891
MYVHIGATGEVHIEAITVGSYTRPVIFVTGDPTIDWAVEIPETGLPEIGQRLKVPTIPCWHYGGAILLHRIVKRSVDRLDSSKMREPPKVARSPFKGMNEVGDAGKLHHTYNTVREVSRTADAHGVLWRRFRINQFFGVTHAEELGGYSNKPAKPKAGQRLAVVVVDDAGLGFGNSAAAEEILTLGGADPWILYKLGCATISSTSENLLWKRIGHELKRPGNTLANRLIVVVKATGLREAGAGVSADLSWERSAQDVLAEIRRNPALKTLKRCKRLIVSFGPVGALLIDDFPPDAKSLYFDTLLMEGPWQWKRKGKGHMFGYGATLVADLAAELSICPPPALLSAPGPTATSRSLHLHLERGIRSALKDMADIDDGFATNGGSELVFPLISNAPPPGTGKAPAPPVIGVARRIPDPVLSYPPPSTPWSILDRRLRKDDPYDLAGRIVRDGPKALDDAPIARFGGLITADRSEIEGLRSLRKLITEYWDDDTKTKPRSVAVFGAPGDGKSFAVREVVRSLQSERDGDTAPLDPLEFNLSQFNKPDDLIDALHQVRDRFLSGEIPLVFWDEFDTSFQGERLSWLRYFLAPMNDGLFQQGQILHPVGRAIFVFAGGTFHSFYGFRSAARLPGYRESKATDFISRLSGYLDIAGLNARDGKLIDEPSRIIHRALLVRAHLERLKKAGLIREVERDVNYGVVRAFLEIPRYRYGARSMRAIIDMSDLHRGEVFSRSSLPPPSQLRLHVNAKKFTWIAGRPGKWPGNP